MGNSSGRCSDKFATYGLTAAPAARVKAPLIEECYASFECRLADDSQIDEYGLFIWEVVKGHVATTVAEPATLHYQGRGQFRVAVRTLDLSERSSTLADPARTTTSNGSTTAGTSTGSVTV